MRRSISLRKKQLDINEKDFICSGWLKKQGGKFKTLKKRYFILTKNILYYFANQNSTSQKGQINLKNLELSELEEDKANNEYRFYILPELGKDMINNGHGKYFLATPDKKEADKWLFYLKQSIYLEKGGARSFANEFDAIEGKAYKRCFEDWKRRWQMCVSSDGDYFEGLFGTPLSKVMPYLKKEYSYVPRIVFECCQYIREHGMKEEGIFRKNGQQSLVLQMKENTDRAIYNWQDVDIHTACSLLKLYLRELPEPLIPFNHYDSLKAVGYRINANEDIGLVKDKLLKLPQCHLQLLKFLFQFLTEVTRYPENRMEISSLGKIFSPNILRDQDTDPYIEESANSVITVTVTAFIKSHEKLFEFDFEPMKKENGDSNEKESDTYSISSAASLSHLPNTIVPEDEDSIANFISFPTRVQSMIILNEGVSSYKDRINSQDETVGTLTRPKVELPDLLERSLIFTDKVPQSCENSGKEDNAIFNFCNSCIDFKKQLCNMTEHRDRLQKTCDLKTMTIMKLQAEMEYLKNELSKSRKLRSENASSLSDVIDYFQNNEY